MNEEQLKRLEDLQSAKELSDAEMQELKELEALHTDSKDVDAPVVEEETPEEPEAEEISSEEEEEALTEEEAKALVTESVKEANTEIKEAIDKVVESHSKAITGDDVKNIVTEALGDREELTEEAVKSLIENTIKSFKGESKMKHEAKDAQVSVPTTERKGNMPVHQKQLLNIMTGKHQDADIPESVLADAKSHGDRRVAAVRSGRPHWLALGACISSGGRKFIEIILSGILARNF